jgi:hypothetical protein
VASTVVRSTCIAHTHRSIIAMEYYGILLLKTNVTWDVLRKDKQSKTINYSKRSYPWTPYNTFSPVVKPQVVRGTYIPTYVLPTDFRGTYRRCQNNTTYLQKNHLNSNDNTSYDLIIITNYFNCWFYEKLFFLT